MIRGVDDGPDGLNDRAFDRALGIAPKRKRGRKPKVSPFERCRKKLDAALNELRDAMRQIDPASPLVNRYGCGHWYAYSHRFRDGEETHTEFFADGPALALIHAEWAAEMMAAIAEVARG